jgi:hypothetical protein
MQLKMLERVLSMALLQATHDKQEEEVDHGKRKRS